MAAAMPRQDRAPAALGKRRRVVGLIEQKPQLPRHLGAVARDQEILAWRKQAFGVVPWRADQRDTASQRLEDAYRGYARERLSIRTTRHVHGDMVTGKNLG